MGPADHSATARAPGARGGRDVLVIWQRGRIAAESQTRRGHGQTGAGQVHRPSVNHVFDGGIETRIAYVYSAVTQCDTIPARASISHVDCCGTAGVAGARSGFDAGIIWWRG